MHACGLDFGTSNSAVALPSGQVLRIDPAALEPRLFRSVLFFPEGEREVHAGAEAIARYLDDGEGRLLQSVKTYLPSATFTGTQIRNRLMRIEDLVALLLRRVREQAEAAAGVPLRDVMLGRPAVFSTDERLDALAEQRLRTAAEQAGFTRVRFLIEPIAAALAYEATLRRDELVLVADFGAGTSDLTLMRLGHLFRAIEAAKVRLSSASEARVRFDEARIHLDVRVTRAEFDRFCAPLLEQLSACVDRLLEQAGHDEERIDAVFLTGGSSQIPAVRRLFAERFGPARLRSGDAFTSVAEGMGRAAR